MAYRPSLGVNVDHVATLRKQRDTVYPDPVTAAAVAELAGADQITVHLREDRRHIVDRDVRILRDTVTTRLNLECAATAEMQFIALAIKPDTVTLVPERREERTTEGGLDVIANRKALSELCATLSGAGIGVSLFVDPDMRQLDAAREIGAPIVELHTGDYAHAAMGDGRSREAARLRAAAKHATSIGLKVAAGHGLDYRNVRELVDIREIVEYNIGHSIVSRAIFVGFERAVREMIDVLASGRIASLHD